MIKRVAKFCDLVGDNDRAFKIAAVKKQYDKIPTTAKSKGLKIPVAFHKAWSIAEHR